MYDGKKLAFGCMRLPMKGEEVDYEEFSKMIDMFIENGFNYFDTAHGYIGGKSEIAIRECLSKRYPREKFELTDKLTEPYFKTKEDIKPFFESQLEACGVDYFDYYLMHTQNRSNYAHFEKCEAYEVAQELKKEGKIKHVGFSFHDDAEFLDKILTEHPEVEFVQIQFNYIDFKSNNIQSEACYNVVRKHGKQLLIMEPVKGGSLVNIPEDAKKVFDDLGSGLSYASYAIRFAASFDGVYKVLSGMSSLEQMADNISYMKEFKPLEEKEFEAIDNVRNILYNTSGIPCTNCRYCVDGCPMGILIPDLFALYNDAIMNDVDNKKEYEELISKSGSPLDCIKCGACEQTCPQHLKIRQLLEKIAEKYGLGDVH